MSGRVSIEQWPKRLDALMKAVPWPWHGIGSCAEDHVTVLRQTDSTQDAARRLNARPGQAIVAWRQTSGRGRLGRAWADTAEDGVAMTIVMQRGAPERLAMIGAITAALAAEFVLKRPAGIKWPNDILVAGRKLTGVLVEQFDDQALIGIGMNVHQRAWPDSLIDRAVSLHQLGVEVDRIDVIEAILRAFAQAASFDDSSLTAEFTSRDVLRGCEATFRVGSHTVSGMVVEIEPMRGLLVETNQGRLWLPAATATLICADGKPLKCS